MAWVIINSSPICHTSVRQAFWFGSDKLTASCGVFEAAWKQE